MIGQARKVGEDEDDPIYEPVRRLIEAWCDRRDLQALATLLPAYTANNGLTDGWGDVLEALYEIRADRSLPPSEHAEVERLVPLVEKMVH